MAQDPRQPGTVDRGLVEHPGPAVGIDRDQRPVCEGGDDGLERGGNRLQHQAESTDVKRRDRVGQCPEGGGRLCAMIGCR